MVLNSVEDIRNVCAPALYKTPARKAIVFGSWARGTQTRRSDIDMLVIEQTDKDFFERYTDFDDLYTALKDYGVDLLIYTPEEVERIGHRRFIRKVLSEGAVIYER